MINFENNSMESCFDREVEKLHKNQLGNYNIYNINEYTFPDFVEIYSNEMASKILKDYYLKMNNLNISEEEARDFLESKN